MAVEPRPARADRSRNDAAILRTAARLLAADPATSMQAIADAAGVARLTVYRRYPNRTALADAITTAADAEVARLVDAFGDWTSDSLHALVRALVELASNYPTVLRGHDVRLADPAPVDRALVALLQRGQDAGVLRADMDAALLNAVLFAVISTVVPQSTGDLDALAQQVADLVGHGMAADPVPDATPATTPAAGARHARRTSPRR